MKSARQLEEERQFIRAQRLAKRTRAASACLPCKAKKARCSDYRPCARCKSSLTEICRDGENVTRTEYVGSSHVASALVQSPSISQFADMHLTSLQAPASEFMGYDRLRPVNPFSVQLPTQVIFTVLVSFFIASLCAGCFPTLRYLHNSFRARLLSRKRISKNFFVYVLKMKKEFIPC